VQWPLSDRLRQYLEVQYDLERVLGVGGMGAVLLARERSLERRVAIKVLRREAAGDAELRERFRREARTAAKLTHPNIVPLHTFGDVEGEMYFVMGYVEGETLADRLRRDGVLGPAEVRRVIAELADALDYAHRAGIVHRDLKPENVLIDHASGRALLTDFGIAREVAGAGTLTATGMIVGTPHYMSPEQASAERNIDGRSDLYSLGVIAYRALTGRVPFGGATAQEIILQHLASEPAPMAAGVVDADPALAAAVTRALRKSPDERWRSARELADTLRHDAADEGLPEHLANLDGLFVASTAVFGGLALLAGVLPALGVPLFADSQTQIGIIGTSLAMGVLAPVGTAWWTRRAHDMPLSRILQLAWRPPRWWQAWWPRAYRRPGDLWDRMPRELKVVRSAGVVAAWMGVPLLGAFFLWWSLLPAESQFWRWLAGFTPLGKAVHSASVIAAVAVPLLAAFRLLERVRRRFGLSRREMTALMELGNVDARWRQERYARVLEPERSVPALETRATGRRDAVESLVRELVNAGAALPTGLIDAVRSADAAAADVAHEMERLRAEVDPDEVARLDRRLATLDDSARDADLRALLRSQRELLARLESRIGGLGARRLRLEEQMRLLHQQLLELRARDKEAHEEITGRIRMANEELRRLQEGWSAADELTTPIR